MHVTVGEGAVARPAGSWRSGHGAIVARRSAGRTVLATTRAASPLRFVRPTFPGTTSAAVCLVTFGGGLVDGDEVDVDIEVEAGATLVAFTQSSTKVFRGSSRQTVRANVEGTLVLLPDPVSAFAGARYTQRVDVALAREGACVVLDGFTSGRAAFGDRWAMTALELRAAVSHDGRAVVTDALRLDSADGPISERAGGYDAFAALLAVGRGVAPIAAAIQGDPVAPPTRDLAVAAGPLPRADALPGAIARVAASSPARAMAAVRARLRNLPDIDAVDPFGSRY
ncbi:MAG: urease accessory protein UreD [Labilithrix sp.]|nr:urease accessory protein UreD [Labilithrix sp.]